MKKVIQSFIEFRRVILRTKNEVYYTNFGFYYQTKKSSFFYSCRSIFERGRVFKFLRENQIKHYKLEEII